MRAHFVRIGPCSNPDCRKPVFGYLDLNAEPSDKELGCIIAGEEQRKCPSCGRWTRILAEVKVRRELVAEG